MTRRLTRRRFALLGSIALTGLAGCGETGEDGGEDGGGEEGGEGGEDGAVEPPQNRQTVPPR